MCPASVFAASTSHTGHREDSISTFAMRGGPDPKNSGVISSYTNCIVTCALADGKNRTPPVLFTLNPEFRTDHSRTDRRAKLEQKFRELLAEFNIKRRRVVYAGNLGRHGEYCKESIELVDHFFKLYPRMKGCTILTDKGGCFSKSLEEFGAKRHLMYEPAVHHFLLPNDNKFHGVAKGDMEG